MLMAEHGPKHFDLILMDCQMPILNGFDTTRSIRALADPVLRKIPILALTANALAEDQQNCLDAGMDGYLSKPFKADELHRLLCTVIENHRDE